MKRLAAASLLVCAAGVASAQEIETVDWTGFHVGVIAGFGEGEIATTGNFIETTGVLVGVQPNAFARQRFPGVDRIYDNVGWSGGVLAGFDAQFGTLVVGAEGDLQLTNVGGEATFTGTPDQGPTFHVTGGLDWYGTVRGRVGIAVGAALPYVTAGFAFGQTSSTTEIHGGLPDSPVGPTHAASSTDIRTGYAVGGGVEIALGEGWSIRGDYLHVGFAGIDIVLAFPTVDNSTAGATNASSYDFIRFAISRRF